MTPHGSRMGLAAGTRLGPYEIVGMLGAGGMGEVYRARDTRLAREVAVKSSPRIGCQGRRPSSSLRPRGTLRGRAEPSEHSFCTRHRRTERNPLHRHRTAGRREPTRKALARPFTAAARDGLRNTDRPRSARLTRRVLSTVTQAGEPVRHQRWPRQDPRLRLG